MDTNNIVRTYLSILNSSLEKKEQALNSLIIITKKQMEALEEQPSNYMEFKMAVLQKETLINKINEIDLQFETLFNKVKGYGANYASDYIKEIQEIKKKIPIVVELGVILRALELQNNLKLQHISFGRDIIGFKKSNKSVTDYYRSI